MHRIALALGLVAGLGATLPAQAPDERTGVPGEWVSRSSGARSVGYGGAFVAAMNEPMGVLWNPAGLA